MIGEGRRKKKLSDDFDPAVVTSYGERGGSGEIGKCEELCQVVFE